jgi:hypothetical protein
MSDFSIKSGSTSPPLVVTLLDNDVPVNLTGASVAMRMRSILGGALVVNGPATIVGDPNDGLVSYQWQVNDTDEVGDFEVEWIVTFSGGQVQVFPADGYTIVTVEDSLEAENPAIPALPDTCWPVDTSCCTNFGDYSPTVQARAIALAGQTMRMLTGYSVGGCPVLLRPCSQTCVDGAYGWYYNGGTFYPHIDSLGRWVNSCGCTYNCSCSVLSVVNLSGVVGSVEEVKIDGVVLAPTAYRLDNGHRLVRLDGELWPACQDMAKADTEVGTFSVSVVRGATVDGLGAYAAGLLACEYAKACTGGKCRLPSGTTSVVRQGISMEISTDLFPGGRTGIREVDTVVARYNPYALKRPSAIWSPDVGTPVTY